TGAPAPEAPGAGAPGAPKAGAGAPKAGAGAPGAGAPKAGAGAPGAGAPKAGAGAPGAGAPKAGAGAGAVGAAAIGAAGAPGCGITGGAIPKIVRAVLVGAGAGAAAGIGRPQVPQWGAVVSTAAPQYGHGFVEVAMIGIFLRYLYKSYDSIGTRVNRQWCMKPARWSDRSPNPNHRSPIG
ncbi:MAG: hypothetical protein JKY56_27215, partial [Kofleriaceae bacterium]|nr:hypothetical protein [Kofleriaceae bacterium]